ncbi:MAG: HEAT repeat domain-containing protein [Myxococcota bacterium]|jgi:hypothetical protein|nr:HEAT repeat domain-containing protein [Myxococcota bacterium]
MKRALSLSFLALFLLLGVSSMAQDPPHSHEHDEANGAQANEMDPKAKIKLLLSAHCSFPTRDELLAVTDDVASILIELYEDPASIPSLRTRAIDALGWFQEDATANFFEQVLTRPETPERELHHAISAYNKAFGDLAVPTTVVFLNHSDVQLRLTAVDALGKNGGKAAQAVLLERQAREVDPVVSEKLQRAIRTPVLETPVAQ